MKKLFFTLCALCLCGTMWAQTYDSETGLYYDYVTYSGTEYLSIVAPPDGSTYSNTNLVSYTGDESITGAVTIPEYVGENLAVTRIDAEAFENSTIYGHLVVPAHITQMGSQAFKGCTGLTEVTYEYSAIQLSEEGDGGEYSFDGCSNVKTVNLNRNVGVAHGNSYFCAPFTYQSYITAITIGENVTSIPHYMFRPGSSNTVLQTATCYAKTPPSLGSDPFGNCIYATLYVPYGMSETYTNAGWSTYFPTIVEMESTGLEEGTYLDIDTGLYFELNNDGTASIYYDEAGVYTDNNLVAHSTITGAYTLPATVQAEEGGTVYNVTRVEASAFANSSITGHLVIPAYIVNMGESAFENCTGLTEVTYEYSETALYEENTQNASGLGCSFYGCSGVTTVNLYRNLSQTGAYQFHSPFCFNTSVETLNIGPRVTTILPYMFRNTSTSSLKAINCYSVNPPTLSTYDPFANLNSEYVINVPFGAESLYTDASSSWTSYATEGHIAELDNAFAITTHDNNEGTAYATFYNGASDVVLFNDGTESEPTELTAYVAYQLETEEDGELVIDIASIGNSVPAGTGVIVETEKEGTYLAIATENGESYSGDNDLYGSDTTTDITVPGEGYLYYLLSSYDGVVGFYWGAQNGAAFQCQAHRAYLALLSTAVTNANRISIRKGNGGEDTTGISSVENTVEGASVKGIYTIQGVRVSNMNQPGLYIVDGKKVLVK